VYAMGRAPKKVRDKDGDTEYEEWIYGEPPKEVNFVRFVGDRVIRIETMKVDGEKEVRTAKEIDLDAGHDARTVAKKQTDDSPSDEKKSGPSLMRPGETTVTATPGAPNRTPMPGGQQGPNPTTPGQPPNLPGNDPTGAPPNIPGGMPGSPPH
jgi:hypothetical protein